MKVSTVRTGIFASNADLKRSREPTSGFPMPAAKKSRLRFSGRLSERSLRYRLPPGSSESWVSLLSLNSLWASANDNGIISYWVSAWWKPTQGCRPKSGRRLQSGKTQARNLSAAPRPGCPAPPRKRSKRGDKNGGAGYVGVAGLRGETLEKPPTLLGASVKEENEKTAIAQLVAGDVEEPHHGMICTRPLSCAVLWRLKRRSRTQRGDARRG